MNKKDKVTMIPKLRFPEFNKNGAINLENGNVIFESISNKNHNSDLPVLAITQEHGAVPRDQIDYNVSVTDKSLVSYKVVEIGDFIISLRSFQGGIEYSLYHGICSPAYIILRKKTPIVEQYYKYYFKTNKFIQDLNKDLEGIRDGKMVSYSQFSSILLPNPENKEQQKIAECLSSLDGLISAEDKKLEALKAHKKGLMQKLFPAEGETVPEWRFPEFRGSGEWEERKLSKVCAMQAGKFVKASEIFKERKDNMHPCYGGNGLRGYTFSYTHSGEYPLIGRQGALCGNVTYGIGDFHATEHAVVATKSEGIIAKWLYYLLINLKLNQYATGQAQPGLSVETLEKITTCVPKDEKEQQKIADCLSSLDDLIISQADKIEVLQAHKKGLMQGLFPSIKEVSE
ncbi:restriction endonuclease subunit S [Paenibacillus graminis]|uniref:Restriction endonuclease subunit S n=1 Tax=Paenibacillus graminis TaxID=189425 RepID=A0A089M195_9BACL|nr:restriction endonuclease subunit S [Paenibacillus graminis]AIQ66927.1 restriction endonuclease subunit S [Paenibacillus graminis]